MLAALCLLIYKKCSFMSKVSMWDTRAVMQDAGVQAHSQKFGFVQNRGKSIENIFKTPENQEKISAMVV